MNHDDQIQNPAPAPDATPEVVWEGAAADATRRKLLKASLIAVPMMATLPARPARAQASLGTMGIFYGAYDTVQFEENGPEHWVPVDQDGNPVVKDHVVGEPTSLDDIDFSRRNSR